MDYGSEYNILTSKPVEACVSQHKIVMAESHSVDINSDMSDMLKFLLEVGKLKTTKRTGWVNHNVKEPESVSDHMYRMAIMSFLLQGNSSQLNTTRCLKIALVHDLAECIVGDITPYQGISKEEKHQKELEAMNHLCSLVPGSVGEELMELWKDYEAQSSVEARAVKDLDRFEMILQAYEYEKAESRPNELQDFFNSVEGKIRHPVVSRWEQELKEKRK